jgi:hypothetical protein
MSEIMAERVVSALWRCDAAGSGLPTGSHFCGGVAIHVVEDFILLCVPDFADDVEQKIDHGNGGFVRPVFRDVGVLAPVRLQQHAVADSFEERADAATPRNAGPSLSLSRNSLSEHGLIPSTPSHFWTPSNRTRVQTSSDNKKALLLPALNNMSCFRVDSRVADVITE